jgi:hypothetical protein
MVCQRLARMATRNPYRSAVRVAWWSLAGLTAGCVGYWAINVLDDSRHPFEFYSHVPRGGLQEFVIGSVAASFFGFLVSRHSGPLVASMFVLAAAILMGIQVAGLDEPGRLLTYEDLTPGLLGGLTSGVTLALLVFAFGAMPTSLPSRFTFRFSVGVLLAFVSFVALSCALLAWSMTRYGRPPADTCQHSCPSDLYDREDGTANPRE